MANRFLIRCDADSRNGYGHFSRCLNLARGIRKKLPDSKIVFLGNYEDIPANCINKYKMEYTAFQNSLTEGLKFAENFDYFILDSYRITQEYIDHFCQAPIKFVMIDDHFNDFNLSKVDLVVNSALQAEGYDYGSKRSCLGLSFYAVREELKEIRLAKKNQRNDKLKNIIIFMGAADIYNAGTKIAKMLDEMLHNTTISLIRTKDLGKPWTSVNHNQVQCLPASFELEQYLKDADAFISGGGLTKYDCAYSCIANAALIQNADQENESRIWAQAGLTFLLGTAQSLEANEELVKSELLQFLSPEVRRSIVQCAGQHFSDDSTQNLVQAVLDV